MKRRADELDGDLLDLAVAKALGLSWERANGGEGWVVIAPDGA